MTIDLTRFYFDLDEGYPTSECLLGFACQDVSKTDADTYEQELQSLEIPYTRIEL